MSFSCLISILSYRLAVGVKVPLSIWSDTTSRRGVRVGGNLWVVLEKLGEVVAVAATVTKVEAMTEG